MNNNNIKVIARELKTGYLTAKEIKAIKASQNPEKVYKGKNLEQSKADYYKALMMKDIWLRKFMQSKGLYLRVVSNDPSNALFGQG